MRRHHFRGYRCLLFGFRLISFAFVSFDRRRRPDSASDSAGPTDGCRRFGLYYYHSHEHYFAIRCHIVQESQRRRRSLNSSSPSTVLVLSVVYMRAFIKTESSRESVSYLGDLMRINADSCFENLAPATIAYLPGAPTLGIVSSISCVPGLECSKRGVSKIGDTSKAAFLLMMRVIRRSLV